MPHVGTVRYVGDYEVPVGTKLSVRHKFLPKVSISVDTVTTNNCIPIGCAIRRWYLTSHLEEMFLLFPI